MNVRALSRTILPILCVCTTACSASFINQGTNQRVVGSNWRLIGSGSAPGAQPSNPYIGLAIGVSGNTLYAAGADFVPCSQGSSAIGESIGGSTQIASDGSFDLNNLAIPQNSIQYSIHGKVPQAGSSSWQGTYTLTSPANNSCVFSDSGSFTATAYPPFQGTYAGKVDGQGLGSGVSLTLDVSQGAPILSPTGPHAVASFRLPLTGTISVSGSTCFTSGTFESKSNSAVMGDQFMIAASMSDGSTAEIRGWFSDQTEKTLQPFTIAVHSGQCNGAFGSGTLTLQ